MIFKKHKMKFQIFNKSINRAVCLLLLMTACTFGFAQGQEDSVAAPGETVAVKAKPVKKTFESVWIIDNQTVMVPVKKTFEMDIMHRFGTVEKGYEDFWGFFAPSNIRLAASYAPINKLYIGVGITKSNMIWDASAKYSIISQTKGISPVSVTYYGDVGYDTRKDPDGSLFKYRSDRMIFFNQLIIARKITKKLSLQIAPNVSHQNSVYGYYKQVDSATKVVAGEMEHNHFAIAFSGRYKLTNVTSILVNVDQPITKHTTNNPNPNISFGFEFGTSSHAFQLFLGNYSFLNPARNNLYSHNNYKDSKFLIGFNITHLWNY
jgi:hypothetical protein